MKKVIFFMFIMLFTIPAYASNSHHITNITNNTFNDNKNEYGAKLDAPKLVHIKGDWYAGSEVSKDFYHTAINDGWEVYGKVTYYGTVLDLSK